MGALAVISILIFSGSSKVLAIPQNALPGGGSHELLDLPNIPTPVVNSAPVSQPVVQPTPPLPQTSVTAPSYVIPPSAGAIVIPQNTDAVPPAPAYVEEPLHIQSTLMFSQEDMDNINQAIKIYDSFSVNTVEQKPEQTQSTQTDLFGDVEEQGLPNLYLSSIVYYSPSNWSIRINGKRVNASDNVSTNRFYVSQISRKEVEIIWKPASLFDTGSRWLQLTDNGKNPISNVSIDNAQGIIKLFMRPNQTFVINTLNIQEGLIK